MIDINFDSIYEDLLRNKISCEEVSKIMSSSDVKTLVNFYINKDKINKLIPYLEEDLQNIYMIINITQFIYNNSGCSTGLTDTEYDILYSIMIANGGVDVITVPFIQSKNKVVTHRYPALRGTLTKIFYLTNDEERTNPSRRYLDEWKSSMETKIYQKTGRKVNLDNEEIYVFPKFDGVSGIFEIDQDNKRERVLTRGFTETNEAEDITHVFYGLPERKYQEFKKNPYGVKTEIMMQEKDLEYFNEKYKTDYKNSRSIVSAIINSDEYDEEKSKLLHVVPLRVGTEDGKQELATEVFKDYPFVRCRLKDREIIRKFALEHRYVHGGLRCDGAVIYIINHEIQEILGRENHKNNYEVAYKFTEEVKFSKLLNITWNVGLFGRVAPVAQVKPVKLKGNTITNISLGSVGRVKKMNLRKGDKIKVLYDIIPYLSFDSECEHDKNGEVFEIPTICPECGDKLVFSDSGEIASCINKKCPCRIKGKILNYLNKMNIDGISYGIIDKLYEEGFVRSIPDLYNMENMKKLIITIDGFGAKSVQSWIDAINEKRTVNDFEFLGSLGIESLSKKTFEKITSVMTIDEIIDAVDNKRYSSFVTIPGIRDKTAFKIMEGIKENKKLIEKLRIELNVIDSKGKTNEGKYSVCFTKIRDEDLEKFIIGTGGIVSDSLTKNTTFLCVPTLDVESSKVSKAKKYNIPIIPIDDLQAKIVEYLKDNS